MTGVEESSVTPLQEFLRVQLALANYCAAIDALDSFRVEAVFSGDAEFSNFSGTLQGAAAVGQYFASLFASEPEGTRTSHMVANIRPAAARDGVIPFETSFLFHRWANGALSIAWGSYSGAVVDKASPVLARLSISIESPFISVPADVVG